MKIFVIGDIVGSPGRRLCRTFVDKVVKEHEVDFVIANGENAASGSGMTPQIVADLLSYGIDVLTSGNHIWRRREIFNTLDSELRLLRPMNYPEGLPGKGSGLYKSKNGILVGIINVMGRVFMPAIVNCPFKAAMKEICELRKKTPIIIVDMHAEATSEKIAFGHYVTEYASLVYGTHTHVATADESIWNNHTAYISDIGMTGPHDSVIGRRKDQILNRFLTQVPGHADVAKDDLQLNGILVSIDEATGKANKIERIRKHLKTA